MKKTYTVINKIDGSNPAATVPAAAPCGVSTVVQSALPGHAIEGVGTGTLTHGVAMSKSAALAAIVRQPSILQKIGSAWQLYFRLVLVEGGRIVGDYRGIGLALDKPPSTVEKWIDTLVENGIAVKRQKGRGVEVELCSQHLAVARMPDEIAPVVQQVAETQTDSVTQGVLKIMDGARMAGGEMTITVKVANGPSGT